MSIFDWILANKQWVFSGIGLAVIGLIFASLKWLFNRRNPTGDGAAVIRRDSSVKLGKTTISESTNGVSQVHITQIATITPTNIKDPLEEALSLQRRGATTQLSNGDNPVGTAMIALLTPPEIREALGKVPPLQQGDVAKHYVGLYVQWETKLWNVKKEKDDDVTLFLLFGDSDSCLIYCPHLRLSNYRELAVSKKGTPITVTGRITNVASNCTDLEDVKLVFHSLSNDNRVNPS